jgi:hypothetical protein
MKIVKVRTNQELSELRRLAYLEAWPLHAQAEAQMDLINGRPDKWNKMQEDFEHIKTMYPYND